jgi:hypothetical protein
MIQRGIVIPEYEEVTTSVEGENSSPASDIEKPNLQ